MATPPRGPPSYATCQWLKSQKAENTETQVCCWIGQDVFCPWQKMFLYYNGLMLQKSVKYIIVSLPPTKGVFVLSRAVLQKSVKYVIVSLPPTQGVLVSLRAVRTRVMLQKSVCFFNNFVVALWFAYTIASERMPDWGYAGHLRTLGTLSFHLNVHIYLGVLRSYPKDRRSAP